MPRSGPIAEFRNPQAPAGPEAMLPLGVGPMLRRQERKGTKACLKRLERGEVYVRRKVMTKVPCSSDVR